MLNPIPISTLGSMMFRNLMRDMEGSTGIVSMLCVGTVILLKRVKPHGPVSVH